MTVTLTIDVAAVRLNVAALTHRLASQGIDIVGVTKAVDGDPDVGRAMLAGGAVALADSRLPALARLADRGLGPRLLIRPPQRDELDLALEVADGLLLSDASTARALSARAGARLVPFLMVVDMGDRRDGVLPEDAVALAAELAGLPGLALAGIAVNFACLSGLQPSVTLFEQADAILAEVAGFCRDEPTLSLGGTYCLPHLFDGFRSRHRCVVRLGAGLYFGHYTLPTVTPIPGLLRADPILTATVIESRVKPGPPQGLIGPDSFGHVPDRALPRHRARHVLLAMGRRESEPRCLRPMLADSYVAGMSSDHTLLITRAPLAAGDTVDFALDYEGLVRAVTSPFVRKVFVEQHYFAAASEAGPDNFARPGGSDGPLRDCLTPPGPSRSCVRTSR
jgi:ornithine racemase